jgi:hypothetical protein
VDVNGKVADQFAGFKDFTLAKATLQRSLAQTNPAASGGASSGNALSDDDDHHALHYNHLVTGRDIQRRMFDSRARGGGAGRHVLERVT